MKEEEKQNVVPQIEEPLEGECESTRPRRNPDLNLKGHLKGWNAEGVYEFVQSVQHPEMKREVMHKTKHVTVSKTAGEGVEHHRDGEGKLGAARPHRLGRGDDRGRAEGQDQDGTQREVPAFLSAGGDGPDDDVAEQVEEEAEHLYLARPEESADHADGAAGAADEDL